MDTSLADFLPDELKREYIENQVSPGTVLKLYCNFPKNPHEKLLIILYKDKNPLFFFINSEISEYCLNRPKLKKCQVKIKRIPNHKFLDYDSWIDCSNVESSFKYEEIVSMLLNDLEKIVGKIDKTTKKEICKIVKKAETISGLDKKIILANLS